MREKAGVSEPRDRIVEGQVVGYTDGSRMEGVAAGASAEGVYVLGSYGTVMDAEMIGIASAWEEGYTTLASDSQAAIKRCVNLTTRVHEGRSWIDEKVTKVANECGLAKPTMTWVKGHSGVAGNEEADRRAKEKVAEGVWNSDRSIARPAGIRQTYPLYRGEPHMKWDRDDLRGLTYLHTDKGPMKEWLFRIGKADSPRCKCGEVQNAAHLMSGCVGGKVRKGGHVEGQGVLGGGDEIFDEKQRRGGGEGGRHLNGCRELRWGGVQLGYIYLAGSA